MNPKNFIAVMEKKRYFYGVSPLLLAEALQISYRTFQRKRKKPEKFELGEVQIIMKILKFTEDERKEALL